MTAGGIGLCMGWEMEFMAIIITERFLMNMGCFTHASPW